MKAKKDISGLVFSAVLVIAFVICSYFFTGIIQNSTALSETVKQLGICLIFLLFGAILFYATRVGDGKQIHRFSLPTLLILDLPALYIILASVAQGLPFPLDLTSSPDIVKLAAAALGYGIPYTFLSGYEQDIVLPPSGEASGDMEIVPDELDDDSSEEETAEETKEVSEVTELEEESTESRIKEAESEQDIEV